MKRSTSAEEVTVAVSEPIFPGQDDGAADADSGPINRSVMRAMALLGELGNHPGGASAMELAAQVGLSRATTFRLLQSLTQAGMLTKSGSSFALGWQVTRLGRLADPYRALLPQIQTILAQLSSRLGEYVGFAAAIDPITLEIIAEAHGSHMLAATRSYMGMSFPLHAGGNGKILLAELTDEQVLDLLPQKLERFAPQTITDRAELLEQLAHVRADGYATIDNESEEGLFAVSVAVRDLGGALIGVLTTAGLDRRMKRSEVGVFVEQLQAAAADLSNVFTSPRM